MPNQSGRRNAAPAGMSRQEPDTPLAHRRPKYPLAGCFPAEPASVSSGKVISTQDSRECNHWTSEYASKNPSLRWSRSATCVRRTCSPTGIATFQACSTAPGIMAYFLAGTDTWDHSFQKNVEKQPAKSTPNFDAEGTGDIEVIHFFRKQTQGRIVKFGPTCCPDRSCQTPHLPQRTLSGRPPSWQQPS